MKETQLINFFVNQSKDLFWIVDIDFQLIYANTTYLNLMKEMTAVEKKLNESVFVEGFGEGHLEKWKAYYNRALNGESFEIEEHFYHTQLNEIQYSHISFEPLTNEDNKLFAVACQSKNISRIVKQWSEANELIDASLDVFCSINDLGNFEFVSAASVNHWGYLPEELIGKPYISFILEEDLSKSNDIAAAILKGEEIKSFVNRYKKKDGNIAYNLWSARWDDPAKLMYCVARDGKEKIAQEQKIQQSEQRFKALVQDGSDLIAIINTEGVYSYISPTSTAIVGITPEEFIGKSAFDFIHPDDVEKIVAALQKISSEEKMMLEPFRFKNRKGEWRWIETVLTNMLHNAAVNGIVANSRDITEKVNTLKKIEADEQFNRTVLESSPDCLKILDAEGRLQFMNKNGLCQMEIDDFGSVKNENWWTLWGNENEAMVKEALAKVLTGETAQFIALCPTAKGTPKWWDVMVSPVSKPGEIVQQIISVSRDITEQKNTVLKNELLVNISKIFHTANNYINAVNGVCKSISKYGNFDLVEVWTTNIEKSEMRLLTHYVANNQDEEFYGNSNVGNVYKISESLVGKVWSQKLQLIWDHIDNNKDFVRRKAAKKIGLKAVLGIPLIFNDEAVGVLKLGTKQDADYLKKYAPLLTQLEKHIGSELNRKKLEHDLTHLYDAIPDIIGVGDLQGRVLKINRAGCELLGYQEDEILYHSFNDFVHPEDIDIVTNEFKNLRNGQLTLQFEIRFITKSSSIVWLSWQCNPAVKEGVVYFTAKNITKEKKLRELNSQTSSLAKIGSWEVDLVDQSIFWSQEVHKMHETDSKSFTPNLESAINFYREDFRQMIQQIIPKSISTGEPFDFEAVLVTAKKKEIWVHVIGDTEMVNGVCKRIYGSFQDINSLKESENRLLSLSENLSGVVYQYIIHPDGTDSMEFISGAVEQLWGYSTVAVMENVNLLWDQIKLGGDFEEVKTSIYKSIETKSKWKSRFKIVKPNGELKTHLGNSGVPIFLADGRIVFNVIVLDITHEAQNEDLLEQVTKLAKIASWQINIPQNSRHWSGMMYNILETDSFQYIPEAESLINFYRKDYRAVAQSALLACVEKGIPIDFEAIIVTALKNEKWVRVLGNVEMVEGKPYRIYGSIQDIDGLKKVEEKLFESEQKYRLINVQLQLQQLHLTNAQQVAKVGSWETDLSTFKFTWSDETYRILE